jgi:transcriptional regulatory protein RtcR
MKPLVVLGALGSTLDVGKTADRWSRWRPTVALCQQQDLVISRFELLHERAASDIHQISPETKVRPHEIRFSNAWDFEEVYGTLLDFARAYAFKTEEEDYLLHITTGTHVMQICWFLLAESREIPARLVQTNPGQGRDRAVGSAAIIDLDLSRYDRIASRFRQRTREGLSFLKAGIETRNAAFNKLIERIEHVAVHARDPILLMGPTGAGKSRLARRIHELRRNRRLIDGPFVDVNCATLRGDPAMSTLFGHVRGSFTGALRDRPGLLRQAHGGTLFLDEIGELGVDEQAMLLGALEEGTFFPMGADTPASSQFQLIAGTNRDLAKEVASRRFREDLFARINLWSFRLPALRDRHEDLEPNLEYELDRVSEATGHRVGFNREARDEFLAFAQSPEASWPGNFRDFAGAITRMATLASGGRMDVPLVREEIERLRTSWHEGGTIDGPDIVVEVLGPEAAAATDRFDRVQLAEVLRVCRAADGLSEAGRLLFAESRKLKKSSNDADRLRKYLARFGVDWKRAHERPSGA